MNTTARILDCGHNPTPDSKPGTGYAYDGESGRTLCYACADTLDRERMAASASHVAYVSTDGRTLTTWSGGKLARVTGHTETRTGFHGSTVHRYWAKDDSGGTWYGSNGGTGMVIQIRRIKGA